MENKTIAVLGGGNGAHALAVDLTSRGYLVNMYEMPEFQDNMKKVFETKKISSVGIIRGTYELNMVTTDIEEAIRDVKYIIILTPAFAHAAYADLLKDVARPDQVIVTIPGSFSALMLKKAFGDRPRPVFVDANDLMYDARLVEPGKVNIMELVDLGFAFMPPSAEAEILPELSEIFDVGNVFGDVLECGLAVVNPALHSGPCILNAGPIEYKNNDFYLYEHGFTPAAAKIDLQLDKERKAVAKAFGYDINPFHCFPNIRHIEERGEEYEWQDLYRAAHGDIGLTPIQGPNDIFSRYLTEDAPCGLVPWANLAEIAGIDTPTIDSIVNLYCVFHETDWWEKGFSLEDLGIDGMSIEEIKAYCQK